MRGFTLLSSAALIVYTGSPASAQTSPAVDAAAQADASGSQSDDTQSASSQSADIVVTGSRISNPNMTSPTPVTAVDSGQLLASQPTTIGAALNNLPQLVSVGGTQANGGTQSAGQFNLNLRGLGATRTLILLDGMRVPATSTLNTVDTNLLPQNLIQRVDIVTGGASAAYGSDAVSGVVNFVLDREFSGLKVEGSSGISGEGDNAEYRGALAFGTDFAGGRGHILLAGEYFSNKGVEGDARDFRREGDNIIVNPNAPPTLITARDVRIPFTFGGLITSATGGTAAAQAQLVGTQFFPNGQFGRFDFGTLTTASNQSGGDGINTATLQPIARPLDRRTAFGRVSYELAPDITAFAQGFYAYSKAQSYTAPYRIGGAGALLIQNDNAFLPDPVRQQMAALGVTSFRLGRYDSEYRTDIEDKNFTGVAMVSTPG
ncbi:TonB-dependent receptor plug domain-containing protein [Tardiphaga sp.]|uniref:TonB-dependent receptor plug domain-containing protein n=1 Tax=Tardiphaga sp. TaxID=1926292 RepID=UPI00352B1E8B